MRPYHTSRQSVEIPFIKLDQIDLVKAALAEGGVAAGVCAPAAMYLAAAGVGTIGIADADEVDLSNLQRQIIHATSDIGKAKVQSAKETMEAINPDVTVKTYRTFITSENIMDIISDYDFIIDGTDNFPAKFLINDACVMAKKPFSHAGIIRFKGQLMTYVPGQGQLLTGYLLTYDALTMEFRKVKLPTNTSNCAVCGDHPTITELIDYEQHECDGVHLTNEEV